MFIKEVQSRAVPQIAVVGCGCSVATEPVAEISGNLSGRSLYSLLRKRIDIRALLLGFCKLCWHNFEHYRDVLAFENNAGIIGLFLKHYWTQFTKRKLLQTDGF